MVKVKLYGVVRLKAGVKGFETNVGSLHELKGMIPGVSRKEVRNLVTLVNGRPVLKNAALKDGDEVVFLSPAGGG